MTASDGVELAWHEAGEGRSAILLHGLFSDAQMNWIKFGHADRIAGDGFRVIMPDLRAHGESGKPHDPACYPADRRSFPDVVAFRLCFKTPTSYVNCSTAANQWRRSPAG